MPISSASSGVGSGHHGTGPTPEHSSSCIVAEAATGSHTFTIDGYSRIITEGSSRRKTLESAAFSVGDHSWSTGYLYYDDQADECSAGWITTYLELRCHGHGRRCSADEEVTARYRFSLLDQNGQPSYYCEPRSTVCTFTHFRVSGASKFVHTKLLEARAATYLTNDRLKVRCDVTVYKNLRAGGEDDHVAPTTRLLQGADVPPSDISQHLGRLLSSGVGADLTFEVAGETFAAHRHILAVRAPVFLGEISSSSSSAAGPVKEETTKARCCGVQISGIHINGMEARVFKALLHYIYTDSLTEMNIESDEETTMAVAQRLIAPASRYGLDRLKQICEDMLWRHVDTSSVAATLAIAEEYNCHGLKKACFRFLMSGSNLKDAMAAGGFELFRSRFPCILKELLAMVVA